MTPSCCALKGPPPTLPLTPGTVLTAALLLGLFVALLFAASLLVPGEEREGVPTDEGRKRYRLNGLALLGLTVALVALGWIGDLFSPAVIQAHFWGLFVAANLLAFGVSAL